MIENVEIEEIAHRKCIVREKPELGTEEPKDGLRMKSLQEDLGGKTNELGRISGVWSLKAKGRAGFRSGEESAVLKVVGKECRIVSEKYASISGA